jgi:hypothetical protein
MAAGTYQTLFIPAGMTANTVIKSGPGRLIGVVASTVGTASSVLVGDSITPSGALPGGTAVIGALPLNTPIQYYPMGPTPAFNGITVVGAAGNPAMTVVFE